MSKAFRHTKIQKQRNIQMKNEASALMVPKSVWEQKKSCVDGPAGFSLLWLRVGS